MSILKSQSVHGFPKCLTMYNIVKTGVLQKWTDTSVRLRCKSDGKIFMTPFGTGWVRGFHFSNSVTFSEFMNVLIFLSQSTPIVSSNTGGVELENLLHALHEWCKKCSP